MHYLHATNECYGEDKNSKLFLMMLSINQLEHELIMADDKRLTLSIILFCGTILKF